MSDWLEYISKLLSKPVPETVPVLNEGLTKKLIAIENRYFPGIQHPPEDSVLIVNPSVPDNDYPPDAELIQSLNPGVFDD